MRRVLLALVSILVMHAAAVGGPGPLNVAVVVNEDSAASKLVASAFIRLRRIPTDNVVHLKLGDLDSETIDVDAFRSRMLGPALKEILKRGLEKQIDVLVWSVDLPHAVQVGGDMKGAKLPGIITPVAAVNGLTYLHERVAAKEAAYLSLSANGYARRQPGTPPRTAIKTESLKKFQEAAQLSQKKEHAKAAEVLADLLKENGDHPVLHYNLACALAQTGKRDEALAALAKAVDVGWNDRNHAERDADFADLRKNERFRDILARIRIPVPEGESFRSATAWSESGKKGEGNRYLLCTMLGISTGRGNGIDEILDHLRRSAAADGTRPKGTIYFMINGDVRSRTRQWGFAAAVDGLKARGIDAQAIEGSLPQGKADVAGLMAGSADFDWPGSKSSIHPGAICEHLTSFGGVMHWGAGQTPISEFIRHGAAGSSGTVTEPYAIQNKFPTPFLHLFYAEGFSLAEAFYLSVQGPYQLLIIGDPLCRPWAPAAALSVDGIPNGNLERPIRLVPKVAGAKAARCSLAIDGAIRTTTDGSDGFDLDPAKLGEGYHDLRIAASLDDRPETPLTWSGAVQIGTVPLLEVEGTTKVAFDGTLRFHASCPGATSIAIVSQGRTVGTIAGDKGVCTTLASILGPGGVEVQAIATRAAARLRSRPVAVEIAAASFAGKSRPKETKPGLRWTDADGKSWRLPNLHDGNLYGESEVRKALQLGADRPFVLEGWIESTESGLWQLDARTPIRRRIAIDDVELPKTERRHVVSLAAGWHHVRIEGQGQPQNVDVRFGKRGLPPIDALAWFAAGAAADLPRDAAKK